MQTLITHYPKIIALALLLLGFTANGQMSPGPHCGTQRPVNWKGKYGSAAINNLATPLQHACVNKKISIVFYVIADSTWAIPPPPVPPLPISQVALNNMVQALNNAFSKICVTFVNCSTVVIPNYVLNDWNPGQVETNVTSTWYTEKTLNVYLAGEVAIPTGSAASVDVGYTYFPGTGKDIIVMKKEKFTPRWVLHVMGHYFGLYDTYDEIGPAVTPGPSNPLIASHEFVDGSNCATNGDGFCDTEADCTPLYMFLPTPPPSPPCEYIQYGYLPPSSSSTGITDGHGEYYRPPSDNYMSAYECSCAYSQEQYNFMAGVIMNQRIYLH